MLPTNVVSFVKKMVNTQPEGASSAAPSEDSGRSFNLWQIGSDLMTVTGNIAKPTKVAPTEITQPKDSTPVIEPPKVKTEQEKVTDRSAACRVCLKSIKPEDFSRTCNECQRKVCEDCASYSTTTDSADAQKWCCSVCRRKLAQREQVAIGDTESSLEVPMPEGLVRRHSDARLGSQATGQVCALGAGLVPPRNVDLRRHSDVSPASLKDLEKFRKVAGERRGEDWEWRSKSRSGSPDRHQEQVRERDRQDRQRGSSPQRTSKPSVHTEQENGSGEPEDEEERRLRARRGGGTVRRKSRVARQHSYDDEIKSSGLAGAGHPGPPEPGLGPPVPLTRRASNYNVYSTADAAQLAALVATQHRASISTQGSREPSEAERQAAASSRRPSFRTNKPVLPYELAGPADDETMISLDPVPAPPEVDQIMPDPELRNKRRGSILPNVDQIRSLTSAAQVPARPVPAAVPKQMARVTVDDRELARQGSLADGEGIKIVIHDVDCDMLPRANAKRKVTLRKDVVVEKGHRTRSFGMRVVGGKTGSDKHLYAVIVWTVSGGPADKAGLQQGDKVLEWGGVSLVDRKYEEVAHIIDRSADVVELIVENTPDMSGDPLDEPGIAPTPEKAPSNLGLGQLESETNKAPSSPTRRKLPKTPV